MEMDINKLFNELIKDDEIKGIPVSHVLKIVTAVFELINSGRFFIESEID